MIVFKGLIARDCKLASTSLSPTNRLETATDHCLLFPPTATAN